MSRLISDIARVDAQHGVVGICRNRRWEFTNAQEGVNIEFLYDRGLGRCVKFDSAPMRLFLCKQKCAPEDVTAAWGELIDRSASGKLAPALTRPILLSQIPIAPCNVWGDPYEM